MVLIVLSKRLLANHNSDTSETFTVVIIEVLCFIFIHLSVCKKTKQNTIVLLLKVSQLTLHENRKTQDSEPNCKTTSGFESKLTIEPELRFCWDEMCVSLLQNEAEVAFESLCCHHAGVSQ